MKKLFLPIATLLLTALVFNFTACQWDVGNVDPALAEAASNYNQALALAEAAANSAVVDENGNVVEDVYTRTSIKAMKEALPIFNVTGKTAEEINAATVKVNEALALLVDIRTQTNIDARLQAAIDNLKLFLEYGDTVNDPATGPYTPYPAGSEDWNKTGMVIYFDENMQPAQTGTPQALYGVDGIIYDKENSHATFNLTADSGSILLKNFINTGVILEFKKFTDLTGVEFVLSTDENGVEDLYYMEANTADDAAMYLAGGLLAVCAGFGEELKTAVDSFSYVYNQVVDATYTLIAGKSAKAYITLKGIDDGGQNYIARLPFSIYFSEIPVIE